MTNNKKGVITIVERLDTMFNYKTYILTSAGNTHKSNDINYIIKKIKDNGYTEWSLVRHNGSGIYSPCTIDENLFDKQNIKETVIISNGLEGYSMGCYFPALVKLGERVKKDANTFAKNMGKIGMKLGLVKAMGNLAISNDIECTMECKNASYDGYRLYCEEKNDHTLYGNADCFETEAKEEKSTMEILMDNLEFSIWFTDLQFYVNETEKTKNKYANDNAFYRQACKLVKTVEGNK